MSRTASPEKNEDTRQAILNAAENHFKTYGYAKTTVADIAGTLGMSPANIYRFFANKQAINEALAARMLAEVDSGLEAIVKRKGPVAPRLREMITWLHTETVRRYISDQKVHDMVTAALAESWPVVDQHINHVEAMLTEIVRQGMESGEFSPAQIPEVSGGCVHAAIAFLAHPTTVAECMPREGLEGLAAQAQLISEFLCAALKHGFMPSEATLKLFHK